MDGVESDGHGAGRLTFGVATAGFQVEGGFNGPGEPRNNWYEWEASGKVEPSGIALDFWNDFERHLDRAASTGVDSYRMSVEWARCEPQEGRVDEEAFARYAAILAAIRERGMEPLVTLHHFTHPAWLGSELWTRSDSPERFRCWVEAALDRLRGHCRAWVTINEVNIVALMSYLLGAFPPGRRFDGRSALSAADHLLAAHVLAYESIKARQPDSTVGTNNCNLSLYDLDRLGVDLLCLRAHGVRRDDVDSYVAERRAGWNASVVGRGVRRADGTSPRRSAALEELLRLVAAYSIRPSTAFRRTLDAVYNSPFDRTLDTTQIDYYDPETASHFQAPLARTAGGRWPRPDRPLWDDPPNPPGLAAYAAANTEPGIPILVVENGLCNRVRRGRAYPRLDGWTRPRYLAANLAALVGAIEDGVPVGGYWHWCLADNYEWGSYEPRFGIFGVDRERGLRWSDRDSMGDDAAGAYRRLIEAIRSGDRAALTRLGVSAER